MSWHSTLSSSRSLLDAVQGHFKADISIFLIAKEGSRGRGRTEATAYGFSTSSMIRRTNNNIPLRTGTQLLPFFLFSNSFSAEESNATGDRNSDGRGQNGLFPQAAFFFLISQHTLPLLIVLRVQ